MVTRDFAKFRDETPNPISLNQRVLGSSPSASTIFLPLYKQRVPVNYVASYASPPRQCKNAFVLTLMRLADMVRVASAAYSYIDLEMTCC